MKTLTDNLLSGKLMFLHKLTFATSRWTFSADFPKVDKNIGTLEKIENPHLSAHSEVANVRLDPLSRKHLIFSIWPVFGLSSPKFKVSNLVCERDNSEHASSQATLFMMEHNFTQWGCLMHSALEHICSEFGKLSRIGHSAALCFGCKQTLHNLFSFTTFSISLSTVQSQAVCSLDSHIWQR